MSERAVMMRACGSRWAHESRIEEGVDERGVEVMRVVDEDGVVVREPQTVEALSLCSIEALSLAVDRDTSATTVVGSRRCRRMHIYDMNTVRLGR